MTTPAGTRNIGYDGCGNTVSETRANGVSVAVAYDAYGRLTGYSRTGETSLVHAYNGLDDRVATTAGGSTRRFVTGPDGRVLGEYGTSATDVKAEFIWTQPDAANDNGLFGGGDGVGGYAPLAVAVGDGSGGLGATTLNWVHGNHMGVPLIITDASGNPAPAADYAAPGFPGQSRTLADLYYNRYRDYDPTTGRYIQADPIGLAGDVNPYAYAMGNPLRYSDPLGLNSVKDHCVYDDNGKLIFCDKPIKEVYWEQWLPVGKFIKACYSALRGGHEFPRGGKTRIAPFGNRTKPPHPIGRWPHYHRPGPKGPNGVPRPGQSKDRHRPWENSPFDKSPWDKF